MLGYSSPSKILVYFQWTLTLAWVRFFLMHFQKDMLLTLLDLVIPNQEKVYYELLLAVIRIINACVVSRGAQNEHTLAEGRKFIVENRTSMMTVMKKHAGIGAVDKALELDIGDLAEAYMVLMSVTDFLKVSIFDSS